MEVTSRKHPTVQKERIVLQNNGQKFQFLKNHLNIELFYVCVFPSKIDENCFSKLENKVRFSVGCGKILNAKLCCDEMNDAAETMPRWNEMVRDSNEKEGER